MNLLDRMVQNLDRMALWHARPAYFCRMHGEPLRYDYLRDLFVCPEETICGTYVTVEYRALTHRRLAA